MKDQKKWIITVFISSFILSAIFSGLSTYLSNFNVIILTVLILFVIGIGILFDMIGVATLTAKESPFHAMNSKKRKGASSCIKLLKNSNKVSSICNDVIGDICGILSGSLGATLGIYLVNLGMNSILATILISSFISALTVGGKAYFKVIAMKNCEKIVMKVGYLLSILNKGGK